MKNAIASALALVLSAALLWTADYLRKPNYTLFQTQTVRVTFADKETGKVSAICSGVYIGDRTVLTAGHCTRLVNKNVRAYVQSLSTSGRITATVVREVWERRPNGLPVQDLGLLRLERDLPVPPAPVSCRMPDLGEKLYAVGMPGGLRWTVTAGTITTWIPRGDLRPGRWLQLDMTIVGGNSGGPVFDRDGGLVGIVSHGMVQGVFRIPTGHNYAVSSKEICEFLSKDAEEKV